MAPKRLGGEAPHRLRVGRLPDLGNVSLEQRRILFCRQVSPLPVFGVAGPGSEGALESRRDSGSLEGESDLGARLIGPTLPSVKINIVTMFPDYFEGPLEVSIVRRAIEDGVLQVDLVDLRDHGLGKHRQLDDTPFGGGPGMVMMVEPLASALEPFSSTNRVLFTPSGLPMSQKTLDRWSGLEEITFVCGRYEGVDQRFIDGHIDEEVSIGDYVLAGGEVAAAAAIEGIARLIPGVVGNPESTAKESFRDGLLEEPVYTRPALYRGMAVPEVLLSGDHGRIEEWRAQQRREKTRERRPDLLSNGDAPDT